MTRKINLIVAAASCFTLFAASATQAVVVNVPLDYNFNGIVHGGEAFSPDAANGFRSISDRALNGTPSGGTLDNYALVDQAGVLDMVHLGNRNAVDGGNWAFDAAANADNIGVQPSWLPNPDQTTATTNLAQGIILDGGASAGVIFHVSNGGGDFDVRFGFSDAADLVATIGGGDWWGGAGQPAGSFGLFAGTNNVDQGSPEVPLGLWEGVIDLSSRAGSTLTSITFENRSNTNAGYGIYALNVDGRVIPEPASVALLGLGGLMMLRRRRSN